MLYDLFICHASEDKDALVRALARQLVEQHLTVWYDEYELKLGDSLRRSLDRGLAESRFGVVILSQAFFAKNWTQYELDGLVTRENLHGESAILPVWHGVDAEAVAKYSLPLAGRVAVSSGLGLAAVVDTIVSRIRPRPSPLVIARDELEAWGCPTPIVTDEYWLDVVEASNRNSGTGFVVDSIWGRWAFPLPPLDGTAESRGTRLAWTALQLRWTDAAENLGIDVSTPPGEVLKFVESHPGLSEAAHEMPGLFAEYAPQLTIPGFGGEFEEVFEEEYQRSLASSDARAIGKTCDETWLLRDPELGGYSEYHVAHHWFSGGMFGPHVRLHDDTDYIFWLLSDASAWLPTRVASALKNGLSEQAMIWHWSAHRRIKGSDPYHVRGLLSEAFLQVLDTRGKDIKWTPAVREEVVAIAEIAREALKLPEPADVLAMRFEDQGIMRRAIAHERGRKRRRG